VTAALIFRDEAMSGRAKRPGFGQLCQAIANGDVDCVVVEDMSRLSRDEEELARFHKQASFRRVRVLCVIDGYDSSSGGSTLQRGVRTAVAVTYSEDLSRRTRRGLDQRAAQGRVTGALPYGFRAAVAPDGCGKIAEPDPESAKVVQRIFEMRAAQTSLAGIARSLNEDGVPPPRARSSDSRKTNPGWVTAGVRHILNNPKYRGTWLYGERTWVRHPDTSRRVPQAATDPSTTVELPHIALVDLATWNAVVGVNDARRRGARREGGVASARRVYPLSSLLRCSCCGASMIIQNSRRPRYVCDASRGNGGACTNKRTVMEAAVRVAVFTELDQYFRRPEVVSFIRKEIDRELSAFAGTRDAAVAEVTKRRRSLEAMQQNLINAIALGNSPASLLAKLHEIDQELSGWVSRSAAWLLPPRAPRFLLGTTSSRWFARSRDSAITTPLPCGGRSLNSWHLAASRCTPCPTGGMSPAGACEPANCCSKNKRPRVKPRGA
jgi:site-specific DNA recombinase